MIGAILPSEFWNSDLETIFLPSQDRKNIGPKKSYATSSRILTSTEIIEAKREKVQKKEQKAKEAEERKVRAQERKKAAEEKRQAKLAKKTARKKSRPLPICRLLQMWKLKIQISSLI